MWKRSARKPRRGRRLNHDVGSAVSSSRLTSNAKRPRSSRGVTITCRGFRRAMGSGHCHPINESGLPLSPPSPMCTDVAWLSPFATFPSLLPSDLLALVQAERPIRPLPIRRSDAASRRQHRKHRRGLAIEPPSDRTHRLAGLPAVPNLSPLRRRVIDPSPLFHHPRSISLGKVACCVHRLSPPSICEADNAPESGPLIHARNVVFRAWSA